MSAALPSMVNKQSLLAIKSKGRVVKGIEQLRCRAIRFAQGVLKIRRILALTLLQGLCHGEPLHHILHIISLTGLAKTHT